MVSLGSAYPVGKLDLNSSLPPMLMASIRMGIVFICLIPFWKFKIPEKKYFIPLLGFSFRWEQEYYVIYELGSIYAATIVSPIIIGAQLAIPFAILISSFIFRRKNKL